LYLEEECLGGLAVLVGGYVSIKNQNSRRKEIEITSGIGEAGLVFDVIDALDKVQYAARDDERIAELANHIVKTDLDKFCIGYKSYKRWRQKNPFVFSAITYKRDLIGFFDIFPLNQAAATRILSGQVKENKLKIEDIVAVEGDKESKNIYIASIMFNKDQTELSAIVAREIITLKIYEHVIVRYAPLREKRFIAYAHTDAGERLLIRAGFKMVSVARENVQRRGLYVLEDKEVEVARARYERIIRQLMTGRGSERRGGEVHLAGSLTREKEHMAAKHVFLSYCRDNIEAVAQIRDDLILAGERVWWDQDIVGGQDWKLEIRKAMREAYAIVVLFSNELAQRVRSGVYPEVLDAITAYRQQAPGNVFLIPVRLSDTEMPDIAIDDTRTLSNLQGIDLFPTDRREHGLQRLLAALRSTPGHPES
jgi:hypothetical protein